MTSKKLFDIEWEKENGFLIKKKNGKIVAVKRGDVELEIDNFSTKGYFLTIKEIFKEGEVKNTWAVKKEELNCLYDIIKFIKEK